MRKTLTIICFILIIFQIFIFSSASAIEWSLDQVIDFVEAATIDGIKVFSEPQVYTFPEANPDNFFTMKGAVYFWFTDSDRGEFWLFNKEINTVVVWGKVEKKFSDSIMQFLVPILSDYINFNDGGKITYIITTEKAFSSPIIQLEYSKIPDKNPNSFTDSNIYIEEVNKAAKKYILK